MNTGLKPLMGKNGGARDGCGPLISVQGDKFMTKTFDTRNRSCVEQTTASRHTNRTVGLLGKSQIDDTASMTHSKMSDCGASKRKLGGRGNSSKSNSLIQSCSLFFSLHFTLF